MTCELRIVRTEGFRLTLDFAGPAEVAAALAAVVARFEAGTGTCLACRAEDPLPAVPEEAAPSDPELRKRWLAAQKSRRYRARKAARDLVGVTARVTRRVTPVTVQGDGEGDASPSRVSLSSLVEEGDKASNTEESSTLRPSDLTSGRSERDAREAVTRDAFAVTVTATVTGDANPGPVLHTAGGARPLPEGPRPFAPLPDPDSAPPDYVAKVLATIAQVTGVELEAASEWSAFLANAHRRRAEGEKAFATESHFRQWAQGSAKRKRENPGPTRGGGRYATQDDAPWKRDPTGGYGRGAMVQGGPSSGGPRLDFNDPDAEFPLPPSGLPALDSAAPPFVFVACASLAASTGASFVAAAEWSGFLANAHRRLDKGLSADASEASFRGWIASSAKRALTPSGRIVQRDPPGPKGYQFASDDDPWDDESGAAADKGPAAFPPGCEAPAWAKSAAAELFRNRALRVDVPAQWEKFTRHAAKRTVPIEGSEKAWADAWGTWIRNPLSTTKRPPGAIVQGGPRKPGLLPSWEDEDEPAPAEAQALSLASTGTGE